VCAPSGGTVRRNALGILGLVLLPEQHKGNPFALQLGVEMGTVREQTFAGCHRNRWREKLLVELLVCQGIGKWPTQSGGFGTAQVIADGGAGYVQTAGDGTLPQPEVVGVSETS